MSIENATTAIEIESHQRTGHGEKTRPIVLAANVELIVDVPEHWTTEQVIDYWQNGGEAVHCAFERGMTAAVGTGWARRNAKNMRYARDASERDIEKLLPADDESISDIGLAHSFSREFLNKMRRLADVRDRWHAEMKARQARERSADPENAKRPA